MCEAIPAVSLLFPWCGSVNKDKFLLPESNILTFMLVFMENVQVKLKQVYILKPS